MRRNIKQGLAVMLGFFIFVGIGFLISKKPISIEQSMNSISRSPAGYYPYKLKDPVTKDPSFKDLVHIIRSPNPPTTVESFLKILKKNFKNYFEHYVLMYESKSAQEASYQNPRAIVFGESAKLIISFNGNSDQAGFSSIETIEYQEDGGFNFREIGFVSDGYKAYEIAPEEFDAKFSDSNIRVTSPNPLKCILCHSYPNPRPIWESYFLWPGAYGSVDDDVFNHKFMLALVTGKKAAEFVPSSVIRDFNLIGTDTERFELIKFVQGNFTKNERYQLLGDGINHVLKVNSRNTNEYRPNLEFLSKLTPIMYKDLAKEIIKKKSLEALTDREAKALALLSCEQNQGALEKILPSNKMAQESYEKLWQKIYTESTIARSKNIQREKANFKNKIVEDSSLYTYLSPQGGQYEFEILKKFIPQISFDEAMVAIPKGTTIHGVQDAKVNAYYEVLLNAIGLRLRDWSIFGERHLQLNDGALIDARVIEALLILPQEETQLKQPELYNKKLLKLLKQGCEQNTKYFIELLIN